MATTFKTLTNDDVVSTRTMLHESIPITGSIISGTYGDSNIKNYSHGMFQSVYDYPYLSSSANHIFDLTVGYSNNSTLSGSGIQNAKKINLYNEMAQILVGYDQTGSIRDFDQDGNLTGGTKLKEVLFVNFARLLTKDEVKKGSFQMAIYTGSTTAAPDSALTLYDSSVNTYLVNSPAGEYTLLHTASDGTGIPMGLLYYQAGIAVLTASIFHNPGAAGAAARASLIEATNYYGLNTVAPRASIDAALTSSVISASCDGLRNRVKNIQFNNTTELNSTVYFCRINHNEFNYSANPTYLSASQMVVKNNAMDNPVSYVTTIGLYSPDNELLAVAKVSEPLKKDPNNEFTLRVRLDY